MEMTLLSKNIIFTQGERNHFYSDSLKTGMKATDFSFFWIFANFCRFLCIFIMIPEPADRRCHFITIALRPIFPRECHRMNVTSLGAKRMKCV